MQKEFITYEQAVDLESIGFDIRPDFGNQTFLYGREGRHIFYTNYGVMGSGLDDGYIYAPTFSQSFRWFREKYNIISSTRTHFNEEFFYEIYVDAMNEITSGYYNTYEEAELACLNKLIEIVKDKKD
jgi:hypothetical protein